MLDELPDQLRRSRVIRKRSFGRSGIIVEGMIHRAGRQNMDSVEKVTQDIGAGTGALAEVVRKFCGDEVAALVSGTEGETI